MIVVEEILVANGASIFMMLFLLTCRQKNRETIHTEDKLYDWMAWINLINALFETISFLIDGKLLWCGRTINYISNSICFVGTVSIGLLWALYVNLRIYRNYKKMIHSSKILLIPWLVEVAGIICNLFGTNIMFGISEYNVYERTVGAIWGYLSLLIYFTYTTYLVYHSKKQGINLNFFPIQYFVAPCVLGVLTQLFFYGITTSCISVSLALSFIQMQSYAKTSYMDELSGLYNRRYLNGILSNQKYVTSHSLYGIMIDINDFKKINDCFGHNIGDHTVSSMGAILFKSIPENSIPIRYAGDEFIILLSNVDETCVRSTIKNIRTNLSKFNETNAFPYTLSISIGYAKNNVNDNAELFLENMDKKMYEEKRKYHQI